MHDGAQIPHKSEAAPKSWADKPSPGAVDPPTMPRTLFLLCVLLAVLGIVPAQHSDGERHHHRHLNRRHIPNELEDILAGGKQGNLQEIFSKDVVRITCHWRFKKVFGEEKAKKIEEWFDSATPREEIFKILADMALKVEIPFKREMAIKVVRRCKEEHENAKKSQKRRSLDAKIHREFQVLRRERRNQRHHMIHSDELYL
ncbi:unnamed protein product [Caenorhabditis auriculariae]|uniref:Uncharacterized protein n=1 Tax=Caenorhabditis auriculariae TaxID=2777116 RepID=A0A8S1HFR4_9PELO|nr:unnamed protein product [Caenorhabditis auriculariae]